MHRMPPPKSLLIPALSCLVFALIALVLIPYPGMQNDEVFFANPIYSADAAFYSVEAFGHKIPWMVMSYSGALKTWIFEGIWGYLFDPSERSLRLPAVLFGLGTILLTWAFTRRIAGDRAAAITTVLLATDTCFQLTNTFDWGPVALQHLLLMGGLLCVLKWVEGGPAWALCFGAFLWGLGLWDKALLIWPLIGLAVATVAVFPKETFRLVRSWAMAGAVVAFLFGASPLIWYNIDQPGSTASTNAKFVIEKPHDKLRLLVTTADGSALFDYMVRGNWASNPREPHTKIEKASVGLATMIGEHRHGWMGFGFVLSLCIGLVRSTRLTAFFLVVIVVTWVQMFITKNTGGAAHHVILLWPFPLILMGVALDRVRFALSAVVVGVLLIQNLLTTNEYLSEFIRFGTTVNWSDAIHRLSDVLDPKMASDIYIVDWGYLNGIRLLHEGDLPLRIATDPLVKPVIGEDERKLILAMIDSPERLFVAHTAGNEMFPGLNDKLRNTAAQLGYHEELVRTVGDRNGRQIFEIFRFQKD